MIVAYLIHKMKKKAQISVLGKIIFVLVAVVILGFVYRDQIKGIFGGPVRSLVQGSGEQACLTQYKIYGKDIKQCCSDLYQDIKDQTKQQQLIQKCEARADEVSS